MKYLKGKHVHTISMDDLYQRYAVYRDDDGEHVIDLFDLLGNVIHTDVGKCVHWINEEGDGPRIYQAENDEQFEMRQKGLLKCRTVGP